MEVSDSLSEKIIRLFDTTCYHDDEILDNYLVEVLPVNKSQWVVFHVHKDFSLTLNSSNMRYKIVGENSCLIELPDGIYEFKQSIKPNIQTVVHFYHLRTVNMKRSLQSEYIKLLDNRCHLSQREYVINREKLRNIEEYINASKWMIEECHDKMKGKEMYEFSKKLLEQYTNECKC